MGFLADVNDWLVWIGLDFDVVIDDRAQSRVFDFFFHCVIPFNLCLSLL